MLGIVAGTAVLGSPEPTPDGPAIATPAATPVPSALATRAPMIVIEHPYREGALVRPADLVVTGYLQGGTGAVRVLVETSRNKMLAAEHVETDAGSTADGSPRFAVTLPVGARREGERLIIHVVAYDAAGVPVEVLRRRVVVGPEEPWVMGDDGLMGGLAFPSGPPAAAP